MMPDSTTVRIDETMSSDRPLRPPRAGGSIFFALAAALLVAACGGNGEPAADSDAPANVTRGLLTAAGAEGGSTARGPSSGPLREVPLAELGFDRGVDGAPVQVIELSDYGCGYCRRFHMETFPALKEEFIETGMVEWKFVPYVTGMFDNSRAALRAAECSLEQSSELFERVNDRLWEDQGAWKSSGSAADLVREWALAAGVDAAAYDACQTEGRRLDRIEAAGGLARELGVRGTPTFLVVGYGPLQGALPLDSFRQILLSVHEDAVGRTGAQD
ncbi:MAG: thioredoxin domain-containing protein [Gemmatimonadota bacterium]